MKDRLKDLQNLQQDLPPPYEDAVIDVDVEHHRTTPFLEDFFTQVNEIQQSLADLKSRIQEIKRKHGTILAAPQPDEQVKEELEQLTVEVQTMMNQVKMKLKKIDKHIKEQEDQNRGGFADIRMKKCQHATLSRELCDIMSEYDTVQSNYKESCKNRIRRQLQIVNPNIVEDEAFEEMIESDNPAIFTQGIITETQQAKNSLREIEARHNDIIKLEESIRQLHELFTDVAHFVASQGEMIDRIEYNVEHAVEYVQQAVVDTKKAVRYQSSARRKKIILAIICIILILIIVLAVYFNV